MKTELIMTAKSGQDVNRNSCDRIFTFLSRLAKQRSILLDNFFNIGFKSSDKSRYFIELPFRLNDRELNQLSDRLSERSLSAIYIATDKQQIAYSNNQVIKLNGEKIMKRFRLKLSKNEVLETLMEYYDFANGIFEKCGNEPILLSDGSIENLEFWRDSMPKNSIKLRDLLNNEMTYYIDYEMIFSDNNNVEYIENGEILSESEFYRNAKDWLDENLSDQYIDDSDNLWSFSYID